MFKEKKKHSGGPPSAALAGMAQWTECWPVNQRVTGSIPSQESGHMSAFQIRSPVGGV